MATNKKTYHSPIGTLAFGNLTNAEPDLSDRMVWQGSMRFPNEAIGPLADAIDEAIAEYRKDDPSFPEDVTKLQLPLKPAQDKDPENPDGDRIESKTDTLVKFVRKLEWKEKKTGKVHQRSAPTIYDAAGTVCNETVGEVGWGTTGRMYFKAIAYDFKGKKGVSFALEGFQIKELKTKDAGVTAAPIEGGWIAPPSNEVDMADMAAMLAD